MNNQVHSSVRNLSSSTRSTAAGSGKGLSKVGHTQNDMEKPALRTLSSISSDAVVRLCEENYIDYWRSATWSSKHEWSDEGGITRCVTGLPQEIFNVVLFCNLSKKEVGSRVDRLIGEFRERRIPLIWHVGKTTTPSDLGSYLEARGYPKDYDLVAMAADLSEPPAKKAIGEGTIVRVCESRKDHKDWISCLASSWDSPEPVRRWMLSNPFFAESPGADGSWPSSRVLYLGLLDGEPCGALMLLCSRGVAGLQCVGTVKTAQRRGVGEAMARAAIGDASSRGHKMVVVLSTTEGVPLYRKAGFRTFGKLPEHGMYFDRTMQ